MESSPRIIPMPGSGTRASAVILADGAYPRSPVASAILAGAERVVCCDGAAAEYVRRGGVPYAIVGDLDSLDDKLLDRYSSILHRDRDQEYNDLTKAVRFCASEGFRDLIILGATGKREDHTIGNVSLLVDYARMVDKVCIVSEYGVFDPMEGRAVFESRPGQQVSLFVFSPENLVTTGNLRYPLKDASLRSWWQGTLNESLGPEFTLGIIGPAIVYRLF